MAGKPLLKLPEDLLTLEEETSLSTENNEDAGEIFRPSEFEYTKIHYISDLHLDCKLAKEYGLTPLKKDVDRFIKGIIDGLMSNFPADNEDQIVIINGDTADSFILNKLFFTKLRSVLSKQRILVTLGNHEFWGRGCAGSTVEEILSEYRAFFDSLNIILLHNDMFIFNWKKNYLLTEKEILSSTVEELEEISSQFRFFILGGTGFTGYDPVHNALRGYYRETVRTIEEDRAQSDRFRKVYDKVIPIFKKNRLFVVTHCPKKQWCSDGNLDHCIYLSGHTHNNRVTLQGDRAEFADNQIGYYGNNYAFKEISLSYPRDIFGEWEDGKYLLPGDIYANFYHSLGLETRIDPRSKVLMLKRSGYYCFMMRKPNGAYWLLAGGKKRNIGRSPDEIYDLMVGYSKRMENVFSGYNAKLDCISRFVKSFGGSGRIHGCIVDIDFYNHLYLCPFSGKLTPYFATDMINKLVYPTIEKLLASEAPTLLQPFLQELKSISGKDLSIVVNQLSGTDVEYYGSTDIYKISRIFLTFQYLATAHIIRMWVDNETNDPVPLLSQSMSFEEILPCDESKSMEFVCKEEPLGVIDLTTEIDSIPSDRETYIAAAFVPLTKDSISRSQRWTPLAAVSGITKRLLPYDILRNLYFSRSKTLRKPDFERFIQYFEREENE